MSQAGQTVSYCLQPLCSNRRTHVQISIRIIVSVYLFPHISTTSIFFQWFTFTLTWQFKRVLFIAKFVSLVFTSLLKHHYVLILLSSPQHQVIFYCFFFPAQRSRKSLWWYNYHCFQVKTFVLSHLEKRLNTTSVISVWTESFLNLLLEKPLKPEGFLCPWIRLKREHETTAELKPFIVHFQPADVNQTSVPELLCVFMCMITSHTFQAVAQYEPCSSYLMKDSFLKSANHTHS